MTAPRPARPQDLEPACALLSDAGLPLAGVDVHFAAFRVLDAPDGTIAGVAGAEVPRDSAPAPMWGSAELRGACPDTATLMALEDPR
jgi:hypothetical protein